MAFFEPPPEPAEPEPLPSRARPPAWVDAPDDELPAMVPLEHFVQCAERVLVAVYHAEVYRQGCSVHAQVIVGRSGESEQRWRELGAIVLGGVERRAGVEEGRIPDNLVRFGVQYAEGCNTPMGRRPRHWMRCLTGSTRALMRVSSRRVLP